MAQRSAEQSHGLLWLATFTLSAFLAVPPASAFMNAVPARPLPDQSPLLKMPKNQCPFTPAITRRVTTVDRRSALTLRAQLPHIDASQVLLAQAAAVSASDTIRYFFAGGMCVGISSGATVPIDVVKTRMQTDQRLRTLSVGDSLRFIVENEGPSSLFTGFGSTLVGFTINGAVKYGLYEVFKPSAGGLLSHFSSLPDSQVLGFMLASVWAELIASTLLCPMEATRIRLVTEPSYGREIFDALPRLVHEKGWGIFQGLPAILIKMVPGTMCQMASYELLTRSAYNLLQDLQLDNSGSLHLVVATSCALAASVVSTLTSQPGDTILSEINKAGAENSCIFRVVRNLGCPTELFRGVKARLVHLLALVSSQLLIYDYIKVMVGLSATGT